MMLMLYMKIKNICGGHKRLNIITLRGIDSAEHQIIDESFRQKNEISKNIKETLVFDIIII